MWKLLALLTGLLLLTGCSNGDSEAKSVPPTSAASSGAAPAARSSGATQAPAARQATAQSAPVYDPESFTLALEPALSGLRNPVYLTHAGDGSGRLFVVEQGGTIRVVQDGRVLSQPFLDVTSLVVSGGERGLLGLAFHPRYRENGIFFVYYTARDGGANTLARYRVSSDANRADPTSAAILFAIPDPASNHNGGMLAFGPDGYLYVGLGDGGGGNDTFRNGQNRQALLGKILRLDVNNGDPYGIPRDNPFAGGNDAKPEIWTYGMRNPWRFSFDRATGDLWIADVGQNKYEEINLQRAGEGAGRNYGWPRMEGFHCLTGTSCDQSGLTMPVAEYDHDDNRCSITGGYVYRGRAFPSLTGAYFYGDYCGGQIYSLHQDASGNWVQSELLNANFRVSSFGEDEAGELYVLDLGGGRIYRLTAEAH